MKLFDIQALSSLRGNMDRCLKHAANGASRVGLSRREIISQKNAAEKAERHANQMKRIRQTLFPVKPFARVAAVKQIGTHNFRVAAGLRIPAQAEITRGELENALRGKGFTGLRFSDGKRVLAIA